LFYRCVFVLKASVVSVVDLLLFYIKAGQVYARRVEAKELSQIEAEEKAKAATQKKDL